jgi:hypothetical protein
MTNKKINFHSHIFIIITYNILRTKEIHEKTKNKKIKKIKKNSHISKSSEYNILRKEKGEMENDEKCRNYSEF